MFSPKLSIIQKSNAIASDYVSNFIFVLKTIYNNLQYIYSTVKATHTTSFAYFRQLHLFGNPVTNLRASENLTTISIGNIFNAQDPKVVGMRYVDF